MNIQNIERISYSDNRNKLGYRMDRNEKVLDWDKNLFTNIIDTIEYHEFTSYPKDNFGELYTNIANYLDVKVNNIYLSNGADGIIRDFLIMYHQKFNNIGILQYTYGMYNVYAKMFNMNVIELPYKVDIHENVHNICQFDKQFLYENIGRIDIFCFVNPNQVSNNDLTIEELESLCQSYPNKLFLIDEAYFGFGHYSAIDLIKNYRNIYIIRSFSKTFGLASTRLGVLIATESSMKPFITFSPIYSVNLYTAKICNFFLENIQIVNDHNMEVKKGRDWFVEKLRIHNYKIISPDCLSVIVCFSDDNECDTIYNKALDNLFYLKKMKIDNYPSIRISCTSKDVMSKLYEVVFKNNNINYDYCYYLYKTKGFFLIEDVFMASEMEEIIENIKDLDMERYMVSGLRNTKELPFRMEFFTKNNDVINNIIYKDICINLVKKCLETDDISLFKDKFICKVPKCEKNVPPHVDGLFHTYNYRLKEKTWGWYTYASKFIQYGIFLTDNTKENGSIYMDKRRLNDIKEFHNCFIEKTTNSAFIKEDMMNKYNIYNESTLLEGKAGSIVIFDPNCIHYGYKNQTNNQRINLYLTFNKAEDGDNYELALSDKKLLIQEIDLPNIEKRMNL